MSDMTENTDEQRVTLELSGRAVARQMLYDLQVEDINAVSKVLAFPPVSEEGDEIERKASEVRRAEIDHLAPLFDHQAAAVGAASMLTNIAMLERRHPEMEITEDLVMALYKQHKAIALAAIYAGVSTLMGNGVISWGTGK